VVKPLCEACGAIGWSKPTGIQQQAIPAALEGRDVIGLAETGSGKTGAFALPVLQALLAKPQRLFAVVLAPTRELAFQIHEVFEALGASIGLKCCCVVGGVDMMTQAIALARKPHVVIATPGRLVDHLENTKGFNLREVKYLVLDEVGASASAPHVGSGGDGGRHWVHVTALFCVNPCMRIPTKPRRHQPQHGQHTQTDKPTTNRRTECCRWTSRRRSTRSWP
jgi:hypothetical protein